MTKQTHRQRKALRSTKKGNSSLRRKTPPHPSPAASKIPDWLTEWEVRVGRPEWGLSFVCYATADQRNEAMEVSRRAFALAEAEMPGATARLGGPEPETSPPVELGAERAYASEPVQSPAQQIASRLNSENLKPRPEPDPNPWKPVVAWLRKLVGR